LNLCATQAIVKLARRTRSIAGRWSPGMGRTPTGIESDAISAAFWPALGVRAPGRTRFRARRTPCHAGMAKWDELSVVGGLVERPETALK